MSRHIDSSGTILVVDDATGTVHIILPDGALRISNVAPEVAKALPLADKDEEPAFPTLFTEDKAELKDSKKAKKDELKDEKKEESKV